MAKRTMAGRKTVVKKAKKAAAKAGKKAAGKKAAPKKAAPKKAVRKAGPKKASAKKAAPKKAAPKKAAKKKAAPKAASKAAGRKVGAGKAVARKAAPKKTTPKKAAPKKAARTKAPSAPARAARPAPIRGAIPSSLDIGGGSSSAAKSGRVELLQHIKERTETSPAITAGDVDADWQLAYSSGDEAPGGDNPTPDQDIVDEIGEALGVNYEDGEELKGAAKIEDRDKHRWELDPASKDDFDE
jgi:hypothetical protein